MLESKRSTTVDFPLPLGPENTMSGPRGGGDTARSWELGAGIPEHGHGAGGKSPAQLMRRVPEPGKLSVPAISRSTYAPKFKLRRVSFHVLY